MSHDLAGYIIPMIRGHVEIQECVINAVRFKFGLISRQSSKRSGTRYNMRGSDFYGNVANFVETEQYVYCTQDCASPPVSTINVLSFFNINSVSIIDDNVLVTLVLIRGSIPLIWTQYANMKYTPEIKFLTDKQKQRNAFSSHFNMLNDTYKNPIICVNLCKEKGQEKKLSDVYEGFWKNVQLKSKVK